jgi:hypothetical protein
MRQGRKSAAQTKAPLKDRIKGSNVNKKGSASSASTAKAIILSDEITESLSKKAEDYNKKHKNKVTLNTLKAVFRRGAGAFSTSHRPNMTRNGWAYARVNKFIEKKGGKEVKKAYIQDDDLLAKGGKLFNDKELLAKWKKGESIGFTGEAHLKAKGLIPRSDGTKRKSKKYMENGGELGQEVVCVNCGWQWNTKDSDEYDKYVCHKCGFDNSLFYTNDIMAEGGLLASNGKPSKLTPEQYRLVRTPEFKAWFGDWENYPQNASKVVDENGEPLVVYHGSANKFNIFDKKRVGENYFESKQGGFFFTQKLNTAKNYASLHSNLENDGFVYYCFLNIKNPLVRNTNSEYYSPADRYDISRHEYINELGSKKNIDGIIIFGTKKDNLYVVNNSNQIKLADGTNTTFDMNNLDIRYEKGGKLKPAKSLLQIAKEKKVTITYAFDQLKKGMKAESEHSDDKKIQKTIALQHLDENIDYYKKLAKMESTFAKGGEVDADNPKIKNEMIHKSGKVGGLLVGKRHSEGGIKAINKSNNSPLEMEGGEVVITRNAVSDDTKREFEGEMLTNREILSRINEGGGGVSFAKGGDVPEHIMVSGKEYKYGGKTLKDSEIVDYCGCKHKMSDGGTTESSVFRGYEIGDDGTYRKPNTKNFGVKYPELKPSEAFAKIYGNKYKNGGKVESIVIIDKSIPSYNDFKNNNKNINLHITKSEYKKYLNNNYKVDFDHLPNTIRMGLLLGNQKLVDKYINA